MQVDGPHFGLSTLIRVKGDSSVMSQPDEARVSSRIGSFKNIAVVSIMRGATCNNGYFLFLSLSAAVTMYYDKAGEV